jgi:hypothetical protein
LFEQLFWGQMMQRDMFYQTVIFELKFPEKLYAAIFCIMVTIEFTMDLRGAGQGPENLSFVISVLISLRTSEKAKWPRPLTACRLAGAFSR